MVLDIAKSIEKLPKSQHYHKKPRKSPYRPKRKNKVELFKALFHYWSVKLLDRTYPIVRDNRSKCHMMAEYDYDTKHTVIKYNTRRLHKWTFPLMVEGVFHEIGHIMQGSLPYETDEQKIFAEYDAETYALRMMRRYYTKWEYQEVVVYMYNKLLSSRFKKDYPIRYEAFKQIREYRS